MTPTEDTPNYPKITKGFIAFCTAVNVEPSQELWSVFKAEMKKL